MREPGWTAAEWEAIERYRRAEAEAADAERKLRGWLIGVLMAGALLILLVMGGR